MCAYVYACICVCVCACHTDRCHVYVAKSRLDQLPRWFTYTCVREPAQVAMLLTVNAFVLSISWAVKALEIFASVLFLPRSLGLPYGNGHVVLFI